MNRQGESDLSVPSERAARAESGFSLLELSVTMGVMAILAAAIFTLVAGSFEITDELREFQDRHAVRRRFFEFCRQNFESLRGEAKIEFVNIDRGRAYASYLSIIDDPFAFSFGADPVEIKRVVLASEITPSGLSRFSLYYLDEEEDRDFRAGMADKVGSRRVVLLDRLREVRWQFFNPAREEWVDTWENQSERPTLIEIRLGQEFDTSVARAVFWIPPVRPVSQRGNTNLPESPDGQPPLERGGQPVTEEERGPEGIERP